MSNHSVLQRAFVVCVLTSSCAVAVAQPAKGHDHDSMAVHAMPLKGGAKADKPATQPVVEMSRLDALTQMRKSLMASLREGEAMLARAAREALAAKNKLLMRARKPKVESTELAPLTQDVTIKHDTAVSQVGVLESAADQLAKAEADLTALVADAQLQADKAKAIAEEAMSHARELAVAARQAQQNLMRTRAKAGLGADTAAKARIAKQTRDREHWKAKRDEVEKVLQDAKTQSAQAQAPAAAPTPAAAPAPATK